MHIVSIALALCVALTVATPGLAATPAEPGLPSEVAVADDLHLRDVFVAALALDPRHGLPDAYRREAAALSARAGSLLGGSPALSLRHQTDQMGTDRGLREWEANLELPLKRWGQRQADHALASATGEFAEARGRALELDVAGLVRDTLWELAVAEEQRKLARQEWQTAQALEQDVRRRVEAGDLAAADLLLVRDETLGKLDEFLLATTAVRHAEKRYVALSGLTRRPLEFSEAQSARTRIEDDHPLLLEARRRVEQAQAELQRVQSTGNEGPQLIVGTRRDEEPVTGTTHDSVGIGIRLPFASSNHVGPAIAAANNQLIEAQSAQLTMQRDLELARHEAEHTVETLRAELYLAQEQHVMAQDNLRMARIAFDLGEIDLVQRLRVQTRAYVTERALGVRKLQLQQAVARYNQAVGETP